MAGEEKSVQDLQKEAMAQAAKEAQAKKDKLAKAAADREAKKGPKVLALVNMLCRDGTRLSKGQEAHISQEELDRLKSEPRFLESPAFKELSLEKK